MDPIRDPARQRSPHASDRDPIRLLPQRWRSLHASDLHTPATGIPFGLLPQRWRSPHASVFHTPAPWIHFGLSSQRWRLLALASSPTYFLYLAYAPSFLRRIAISIISKYNADAFHVE